MMVLIKVAANSRTAGVAGAIAGAIREHSRVDVQAIGATAVNQAAKALSLARQYLVEEEISMVVIPYFVEVEIGKQTRTAVRFTAQIYPSDRLPPDL
ncbi:MAG: stage V sporulation protein S [Caldilineaceae bacterium]|nr:stage V sporulation protein S [Caldilineaceae bacterium]